jgi:hypothetical protein
MQKILNSIPFYEAIVEIYDNNYFSFESVCRFCPGGIKNAQPEMVSFRR